MQDKDAITYANTWGARPMKAGLTAPGPAVVLV